VGAPADVLASITPDRLIELTDAIIRAQQPDGGEERRARVIADLLDQPGIEVTLDWVLPGRPNVIARVRGTGDGPGLLLNGHLDAAYIEDGWSRDPLDPWVADGEIYGGAVTDMLGGVAAMVAAVEAAARCELPGDLVFLGSMHHDTIGLGVKYALEAEGGWPAFGICGEPSSLQIHVANGGAIKYELAFTGRSAHISRIDEGADALAAAVGVAHALRGTRFSHEPDARLPDLPLAHVGEVHGGFAPGAVADRAVVRGDIRTVPSMTRDAVRADLQAVVDAHTPAGVAVRIDLTAVQRGFFGPTSGPLVDAIAAAHRAVRDEEVAISNAMPNQAFVVDAADMVAAGVETVVYGPADWHYAVDEHVPVTELVDAARVYLETAARLTASAPQSSGS
jgi:acetylornithine deacetylase